MNLPRVLLPELLSETVVGDSFGAIGVLAESDGLSIERQRLRNRSMLGLEWHSPLGQHGLVATNRKAVNEWASFGGRELLSSHHRSLLYLRWQRLRLRYSRLGRGDEEIRQ